MKGKVKWFNAKKGCKFLAREDNGTDTFVQKQDREVKFAPEQSHKSY